MRNGRFVAAIFGLSLWLSGPASADLLTTFLDGVNVAARPPSPLRAEGGIESEGLKGKTTDRIAILERAGHDPKAPNEVSVELEKAKVHLLALPPTDVHLAADGKPANAKLDAAVGMTTFTAEDFLPFSAARCAAMRTADMSSEQMTVVCEPKRPPSQYMLMVYKFDREKFLVRQVLLYKDTLTNLVKMVRNDDFVEVGNLWRPKTIVITDFKLRTKDTISLEWRPDAAAPAAAFDPKSFAASSLLQRK